ncbi:MAG TPA: cellulase family glycosylhydrolase [Rhizomicrobium sp.]
MSLPRVRQEGALFLDTLGRQVMLRGVNLGGDCKVPWPDGGTENYSDFSDHETVSFIGRPFPLEQADDHLGRIARWGFNTLRLLTTWEAVEHGGRGEYDEAYLDYFTEICRRANEHGLYVFVDFHQDVWSRMTGGDGAPGWLFGAVGLDFTKFDAAGAAHVMQARYDYRRNEPRQDSYPQMSWGSNYRISANGIMWTLFWGGRYFTPQFQIDGRNVQDFLQGHYLGAMDQIARRVRDLPNVLGFDTLNEPGLGWMGQEMSYRHIAASEAHPDRPRIGPALSPLDCLAVARGLTVTAPLLTRAPSGAAVPTGTKTLNPGGISIWKSGAECPFGRAGAYVVNGAEATARDEDFFRVRNGRNLSITADGFKPLFDKVASTIRAHQPEWSVFAELDPFARASRRHFPDGMPERSVNAGHWYDAATLYLKRFDPTNHYNPITGETEGDLKTIGARYSRDLGGMVEESRRFPGGAPTLIGEFGIPFDLDEGAAYELWAVGQREHVWDSHIAALSLMYDALDEHGLHSTQWNYTASNRNDLRIGDRWNQEDLSIFSVDQQDDASDPDSGGRAIEGFCRPFARRVQGRLHSVRFDNTTKQLTISYDADSAIRGATEIYVPRRRYPTGFVTRFEGVPADLKIFKNEQRVEILALASGPVTLRIEPVRPDR